MNDRVVAYQRVEGVDDGKPILSDMIEVAPHQAVNLPALEAIERGEITCVIRVVA